MEQVGPPSPNAIATAFAAALAEAQRFEGATAPNPPVGAAALDSAGRILGVAAHERAGTEHAEAKLLRKLAESGLSSEIKILVVTLEPCNHHGRTPPCCDAILQAGVPQVIYGAPDPNPSVAGGGAQRLAASGVCVQRVEDPEIRQACARLIGPFVTRALLGLPWVTVKQAVRFVAAPSPGFCAEAPAPSITDGHHPSTQSVGGWLPRVCGQRDSHELEAPAPRGGGVRKSTEGWSRRPQIRGGHPPTLGAPSPSAASVYGESRRCTTMLPPAGQKTFTSPASLRLAHELRKRADALLTGSGTVLADRPEFTVRHVADHACYSAGAQAPKQRWLSVLDRRRRVPALLPDWCRQAQDRGFLLRFADDLETELRRLAQAGVLEVLVEAGPQVTEWVLQSGFWSRHVLITSPESSSGSGTESPESGSEPPSDRIQDTLSLCSQELLKKLE